MTRFERWYMKRIMKQQVRQGPDHAQNITELYSMVREAAEEEFTEDNVPTLNDSLVEWFHNSLRSPAWVK